MKDSNSQKNTTGLAALFLGVMFFASTIFSYAINFFGYPISDDPTKWGVLGDYIGGLTNPLLGLVTIWLLTISLRQNNEMLDQARKELKATLEELKRGQEIQAATENALKEQISLAQSARDLEGAIKLITYWQSKHDILTQAERDEIHHATLQGQSALYIDDVKNKYVELITYALDKTQDFDHIIGYEAERLLKKYPPLKATFE